MKRYLLLLSLCFAHFTVFAQNGYWKEANSPYGGNVSIIPTQSNVVYAWHSYSINRSADFGLNWERMSITEVDTADYGSEQLIIGSSGTFYKTVGYLNDNNFVRKFYASTDEGQSWVLKNSDLPYLGIFEALSGVLIGLDNINDRILRSTNGGASWQTVATGIFLFSPYSSLTNRTPDGKILISDNSDNRLLYSANNGLSWVEGESPSFFSNSYLAASGTIFALDELGPPIFNLYRSVDHGITWDTLEFDLGPSGYLNNITSLNNGKILLSSNSGLYESSDDGLSWQFLPSTSGQSLGFSTAVPLPNGDLLANQKASLFRSSDNGHHWSFSAFGMKSAGVGALNPMGGSIQFAIASAGLWKTMDDGNTWNLLLADTSTSYLYSTHPLAVLNEDTFSLILGKDLWATIDGGQSFGNLTPAGGLSRGNVFTASTGPVFCTGPSGVMRKDGLTGIWSIAIPGAELVDLVEHPSGDLFAYTALPGAGFQGFSIWRSLDAGETWTEISTLTHFPDYRMDIEMDKNGKLYVTGLNGHTIQLAISEDKGESWVYRLIPEINTLGDIVVNDLGLIFTIVYSPQSRIMVSADEGESWYYLPYPSNNNISFNNLTLSPEGYLYGLCTGIMLRSINSTEFGAYISGRVTRDADGDCSTPDAHEPLKNWVVELEGENTYYSSTNENGRYTFFVDTGHYTVKTLTPQSLWWSLCDTVQEISANDLLNADTANFVAATLSDCPLISVNVGIPQLRRCFDNQVYIEFCNQGTETADSAWVDVMLDPYLSFVGSAQPHEALPDNTIRFFIGDVPSGECGQFQLSVHVDCDSTVIGQTHCITAHGFPDTLCTPVPSWSGANIEASAVCQDSMLHITLRNTGNAPSQTLGYIIIEDDVVLFSGQKDYAPGESFTMDYPANGATWRVESAQEPGHPFSYLALAFAEGCGGFESLGFINQFTVNGIQPSWHRMCVENIGSYDPNDKQGFPIGHGTEHHIRQGQSLDYLIRFQNTGTDTAFTVIIRDTLSTLLNPASIRPGASSHPYTWDLTAEGIISFTFTNIALPDSNKNEPGSHGFVQFNITPRAEAPLGSIIENKAAIYFDFNSPVITNTTWHTLEKNPVKTSTHPIPPPPDSDLEAWPNPFSERVSFHIEQKTTGVLWLRVFNSTGALVAQKAAIGPDIELNTRQLPAGLYWANIQDKQGRIVGAGKLIKQ